MRSFLVVLMSLGVLGVVGCTQSEPEVTAYEAALRQASTCEDVLEAIQADEIAKVDFELKQFTDDAYDAFGEATAEVYEETRGHSALAAEVHDNFMANLRELGGWQAIAEVAFSNQRNRVLGIGG